MRNTVILVALLLGACAEKGIDPASLPPGAATTMAAAPDWFAKPPEGTDTAVFGVGTDASADPQFAVDRATLAAVRSLVMQKAMRLDLALKDHVEEIGSGNARRIAGTSERTSNASVGTMAGPYSVMDSKVIAQADGRFRAYVLIRGQVAQPTVPSPPPSEEIIRGDAEQAQKDLGRDAAGHSPEPPAPAAAPQSPVAKMTI